MSVTSFWPPGYGAISSKIGVRIKPPMIIELCVLAGSLTLSQFSFNLYAISTDSAHYRNLFEPCPGRHPDAMPCGSLVHNGLKVIEHNESYSGNNSEMETCKTPGSGVCRLAHLNSGTKVRFLLYVFFSFQTELYCSDVSGETSQ
jgi:hypothetical protein